MTYEDVLAGFVPEESPDVSIYDADQFPPRFKAGTRVRFMFHLAEKDAVKLSPDKKVITVGYDAEALAVITKEGEQPVAATSSGAQPMLRFQSADSRVFKKSDGTSIPSRLHRLYRALVGKGAAKETGADAGAIVQALMPLDGRETFEGTIGWKYFDKESGTEWSTGTAKESSKEKADGTMSYYKPWPQQNGALAEKVEGNYPREFVQSYIEKKVAVESAA